MYNIFAIFVLLTSLNSRQYSVGTSEDTVMMYTSARDDEAAMKVYKCGGTSASSDLTTCRRNALTVLARSAHSDLTCN